MIGTCAGIRPSDVLRNEKTSTTNGSTAPAIKPCTIGTGIHMAIRPVSPSTAVTRTIAPASIAAPASSGKPTRSPSDAKKMSAKTFPVSRSGTR
jgi:hypothetical protein